MLTPSNSPSGPAKIDVAIRQGYNPGNRTPEVAMPPRIRRITMYTLSDFKGREEVLRRLEARDLAHVRKDGSISVFPGAAGEVLQDDERALIYELLNYAQPDAETSFVVKKPGVVGGRAAIAGTRIPLWQVVASMKAGSSDEELRMAYGLSDEMIRQVRAYYERHRREVDADIFENHQLSAP